MQHFEIVMFAVPAAWHAFTLNVTLLQVAPTPSERFALEKEWKLTEATGGQKTGAIALGVANLVGVVILGGLLADAQTRYSLAQSSLSFVLSSFPALQVCCLLLLFCLRKSMLLCDC